MSVTRPVRLAVIATHPVQYYAPWFRFLASQGLDLHVFYLDDPASRDAIDPEFGTSVRWDTPLLSGYRSTFLPNRSARPGSHHYLGLHNPSLLPRLRQLAPSATLLMAYNYRSLLPLLLRRAMPGPVFLRGDSHLLGRQSGWRRRIADLVIGRAFGGLHGALYVGRRNREYFRFHGVPETKLHHSPPAVNPALFRQSKETTEAARQWRSGLGICPTHTLLLFVGKFIEKKRPLDLLHAFVAAAPERCSLLLVGDGPLDGALRKAAAGQARIYFAPFQNQTAMPRTYAAAELLVLPSLDETWGLVVNEAFAMGLPAVVSDRVGCSADLVRGRETGLEFAATDVAALSRTLTAAVSDPDRRRQWSRNAQALIQSEYHYGAMSRGLFSAFQSAGLA